MIDYSNLPVQFMPQMDCTKVMVGSIIEQKGWTGPAKIVIYGDTLVLYYLKTDTVLRSPRAPRNVSFEPYIDEATFNKLIEGFIQVPVENTQITIDNSHLAQLRK